MPSLLPGFEYDIFISYRQKDNKGDRWVTEFVKALKTELEATFKEDISIYFDENPHDGLLETHHVDKSLEGKLKCLIFIPIISQTYCDTKSFAWQQEFCAFNKLAKEDLFGRDIKLSNGNVASRILPVKIHGLDAGDLKALETEIGSVLRAVEFIYKEPGVNRPLSPDDDPSENLNRTKYRNQVNKVANAVKEIISGIKNFGNLDFSSTSQESSREEARSPAGKSIVVLPFEDMSPEKDQEYFCDGLAEEVINALTRIKDIHVVARTSAFSFKGKEHDARKIGKKLNVESLLEGSVRNSGNKLRITVQLINVADGFHLWSERYDREVADIFTIQDEIAMIIVEKLKINLESPEKALILKRSTENTEAYDLYLKGNHFLWLVTPETLNKAIEYFELALDKDPRYALAYAGLAMCYNGAAWFEYMDPQEAFAKGRALATKGLEIDESLAEAHNTVGYNDINDRNWSQAEQHIRRAIELKPNYPDAHLYYGWLLGTQGRIDEAMGEMKQALKLDPLSLIINANVSFPYFWKRQHNEAISQCLSTLKLEPSFYLTHWFLGIAYAQSGDYQKAISAFQKAITLSGGGPFYKGWLGHAYAAKGEKQEAVKILAELEELSKKKKLFSYQIGLIYIGLGDNEQAMKWVEKACAERAPFLVYLKIDPYLDPLRSKQSFKTILTAMRLTEGRVNSISHLPSRDKSIIVLPFENMSPDKDNEYFSDGLTEELIADLSKVRQLSVISRISAMTFKGTKKKVREIAAEMSVRYVLEGSVRKDGNKLRITAQLIDGASDTHLWSDKYTGTLDSVFEFQEKLSRSIVEALRIRISPDENSRMASRGIASVPAYEKYLQAKSEMATHAREGLNKALRLVNEALQITGDNELLYGTLAGIYYWLWFSGFTNEQQGHEAEVKRCMERCFLGQPASEPGFFASGVLNYMQNKRQEAAHNFKRSLELDPSNTETMLILGVLYLDVGRPEAAGPLLERVLQLDPLSGLNQGMVGYLEWQNGRFQIGLPYWKRSYELLPSLPPAVWSYACALASAGMLKEVIQFIDDIPPAILATPFGVMARLLKSGLIKDEPQFRALLSPDFVAFAKSLPFISRDIAGYFGMIGAIDEALDWVENAINLGYINYPFLALHHPFYGALRSHPRFDRLMDRIKQPWESFKV